MQMILFGPADIRNFHMHFESSMDAEKIEYCFSSIYESSLNWEGKKIPQQNENSNNKETKRKKKKKRNATTTIREDLLFLCPLAFPSFSLLPPSISIASGTYYSIGINGHLMPSLLYSLESLLSSLH